MSNIKYIVNELYISKLLGYCDPFYPLQDIHIMINAQDLKI